MMSEAYLCKQFLCIGIEHYLFSAQICDLTSTCHRTALCLDHGLDIRVVVVGAVAVDAMMMMSVLSVSVKRERCASTPWWARWSADVDVHRVKAEQSRALSYVPRWHRVRPDPSPYIRVPCRSL